MSTWREKYRKNPDLADSIITTLRSDLDEAEARVEKLEHALEQIRDTPFVVYEPVREIAREALK